MALVHHVSEMAALTIVAMVLLPVLTTIISTEYK